MRIKKRQHIIKALEVNNNFVLANPLLPCGTIRVANAQTKELQISNTQAITPICNTFVFFHPYLLNIIKFTPYKRFISLNLFFI